jgi:hypothetical protein
VTPGGGNAVFAEAGNEGVFFQSCGKEYFAGRVNYATVTAVVDTVTVHAHAIDGDHIALVFHGTGRQQDAPVGAAFFGPVGYAYNGIIVLPVPHKNRETEVEAYQRTNFPATPFNYDLVVSAGEILIFFGHDKQVTFVKSYRIATPERKS